MSNVEDLVFVSKSNPHKGRWSTLPEDGALQRSQCWVQYCSQVVDSAIAIVHHSTDYVTICHYIYLYIYIYIYMSWFSHSDAISWYVISLQGLQGFEGPGMELLEQPEQLEQDQI